MNIKINPVITLIFLFVSILLGGCCTQAKLPDGPVYFVDANSGESIVPVLIIPNYSTFSGITTKMGHGPQKGKNGILYANPFIYYSDGAPFKVKQPLSTAIIVPFIWMGIIHKGITFGGVDVYAKGYKIGDVPFRFLIKPRPQTFKLKSLDQAKFEEDLTQTSKWLRSRNFETPESEPLDEADKTESDDGFTRISEGLRNRNFEVLLTYHSIRKDTVLEFDFSKKELRMMEDFFRAGAKTE